MTLNMGGLRSHILHNQKIGKQVVRHEQHDSVTQPGQPVGEILEDTSRVTLRHPGLALLVSCPEAGNVCWFSTPAQLWSLREGPLISPLESLPWQRLSSRTSIRAPPEMGLGHLDITPHSTLLFVSPLFPNLKTYWGSASPNADLMKVRKRPFPHDALLPSIGKTASNVLNLSHVTGAAHACADSALGHWSVHTLSLVSLSLNS